MSDPTAQPRLAGLLTQPALGRVLAALHGEGEETRIVGGAVRDALLGRDVREIDLATTALPTLTMERARRAGLKAVPTGFEHGTVTVVAGGTPFEVTTLREDVETDGRHAVVRFGRDFTADAMRRDFTLNALSLDPEGRLHDPVGGLADLEAGRVRFIGEARTRIREDYLRILRFFRFSADYAEGPPDAAGLAAAILERDGLARLSRERVGAEILKLMGTRRAAEMVATMSGAGLLLILLGGVVERGRLGRAIASDGAAPDRVRRLGALSVMIAEDAARLQERLRLGNADGARLASYAGALAALKSAEAPLGPGRLRRLVAEHGLEVVAGTLAILDGEGRPELSPDARNTLARLVSGEEAPPLFPIRGADLVARGVSKGPEIGRALAALRARWLEAGCPPEMDRAGLLGMIPRPSD